jgi:hypothetical protein
MKKVWRGIGRVWDWVRDTRYRGHLRREALEQQRYDERQARHEAGIYESPSAHGGGFG